MNHDKQNLSFASNSPSGPNLYLCIRSDQPENIYGRFVGEILRSEGLNGFVLHDIDRDGWPEVHDGDMVVLTRCFLRKSEIEWLIHGVDGGANVVCIHPSRMLLAEFGWETETRVAYPGWIRVAEGRPGGGRSLQTHVPISRYSVSGDTDDWELVADIAEADKTDSESDSGGSNPAIVWRKQGGGAIAFFFYDLPKAVARIRFGNADLASLETLGFRWWWPHAADLYTDHVDDEIISVPQADYHCQLLAGVLTEMCKYPLARLWYYPETSQRSAAIFQSDGDSSEPAEFEALSECLLQHGASATFYLMKHTKLSSDDVERLRKLGHTFGPHVFGVDGQDELYFRYPEALKEEVALFKQRFGQCSRTIQSHYAPWMGYMSWVPEHIEQGYRMLFAHMSVPASRFNGLMCGSGRPMRFYDTDGICYDCWQQPVLSYDDSSLQEYLGRHCDEAVARFEALLQSALDDSYTSIGILSHPVSFVAYSKPYMQRCLDLLAANNVPIFNGDQWCDFLYQRDAIGIGCHSVSNDSVSWCVSNVTGRIPLLLPIDDQHSDSLRITVDGQLHQDVAIVQRWGQKHAAISLDGRGETKDINVEMTW
ncbi:MAG: hypothetical protein JW936_00155 [Sedimentisphaerales bacterium]|nr:hypothetical protein [Sedimentisphaerales bacterium]